MHNFAAKSWSNSNTYIHVGVHEFPGSYQPPNQGREIKFINNSRGSDMDAPSEPKIDKKLPPSSKNEAISGEGVKEQRITTTPGKPRERQKGEEDERDGAEQPVVDHDDREVFVNQLTEAGVRKGERGRERQREERWRGREGMLNIIIIIKVCTRIIHVSCTCSLHQEM